MHDLATLLVVDDEPDNYEVVVSLFEGEPYEIFYANSAERADEVVQTVAPDLLLLDVMMPGIDGIEYCRRLKSDPRTAQLPVVMSTALNDKLSLARCFEGGADDFVGRPLSGLGIRAGTRANRRGGGGMAQSRQRLRHQQRALDGLRRRLTASLPHGLRTPLNGIIAPLDLLREECARHEDPALDELLGIVSESSERMGRVVERLLVHLRIEGRHIDARIEPPAVRSPIPLGPVLATSVEEVLGRHGRTGDLATELPALQGAVRLEETFLRQLLVELLDNACKFSFSGQPLVVDAEEGPATVLLTIENLGARLQAEQLAHVGAFVQFDRKVGEQQGLGLGLALAHGVVDLLPGARLTLDEGFTEGVRWHLQLPLA